MSVTMSLVPARHVIERSILSYRQLWVILVAGFAEPVFYLFGLGIGLGQLIGDVEYAGRAVEYSTYVAPGLVASSAMNGAIYDATFNFYYKLKHAKTFDAMLATPLRISDVVLGEVGWAMIRGFVYATAFVLITVVLGLVQSWWALLAVPAALLIGMAFAAVGIAVSSYLRSWNDFDYLQLVLQPLFLASTTFYALDVYPEWSHPIVQATPLYHGVTLCRALMLGNVGLGVLWHVLYLLGFTLVGVLAARRRLVHLLMA